MDNIMPKKVEDALKKAAAKAGIKKGSKKWGAYVYGTMKRAGIRQ